MPTTGHDGRPINSRPLPSRTAPNHTTIVNNKTIINNIHNWNRSEIVPGRYYWHEHDGMRFCHRYEHGFHWWGFYIGSLYYWTRYYDDLWWWYDPIWHRWCYHRHGWWWWQDPVNVRIIYVYRNGAYSRVDETPGGIVVQPPDTTTPPSQPDEPAPPTDPTQPPTDPTPTPTPDPQPVAVEVYSQDGTRLVRIQPEKQEAFLYALASNENNEVQETYLAYLGEGVAKIVFKNDADGHVDQILTLTANDATFVLFDKDGKPVETEPGPPPTPPSPAPAPSDDENSRLPQTLRQPGLGTANLGSMFDGLR